MASPSPSSTALALVPATQPPQARPQALQSVPTLSAQSVAAAFHQFTLFPKLPTELRLRIWKMAMMDNPRVIEVSQYCWSDYMTDYRLPAVHFVNQESHSQSLKLLQFHFSLLTVLNEHKADSLANARHRLDSCIVIAIPDMAELDWSYEEALLAYDAAPWTIRFYAQPTQDIAYINFGHGEKIQGTDFLYYGCTRMERIAVCMGYIELNEGRYNWKEISESKIKHFAKEILIVIEDVCCTFPPSGGTRLEGLVNLTEDEGSTALVNGLYTDDFIEYKDRVASFYTALAAKDPYYKAVKPPVIKLVRAIREPMPFFGYTQKLTEEVSALVPE